MKKIALVAMALMTVTMVACSNNTETQNQTTQTPTTQTTVVTYANVEDQLNNTPGALESLQENSGESDDYTIEVSVEGNSIKYKYINKSPLQTNISIARTTLDRTIRDYEADYENVLASIKTQLPNTESIIVEYYTLDNKLIASYSFK